MHVTFVGYTPTSYTGNLSGRSGAHALCYAAFAGSHFCTNWEVDQTEPPPNSNGAWIDVGNSAMSSRFFRSTYATYDGTTCAGWTSASATLKLDLNVINAPMYTPLGGFATSWVSDTDGGCETPHPLACCQGGTTVRYRGLTAAKTGNLGGRSGARAICDASFPGSHFCTNWEADEAAIRAPVPATGVWVDIGNSDPTQRFYRQTYATYDGTTCAGWTSDSATLKLDLNVINGPIYTTLGGFATTWVSDSDGGCETPRPLACCDGGPPQ
jgi:hypothetical protein